MRVATPIISLPCERLAVLRTTLQSVRAGCFVAVLETIFNEEFYEGKTVVDIVLRVLAEEMRQAPSSRAAVGLFFKIVHHLPLILQTVLEDWQVTAAVAYSDTRLLPILALFHSRGINPADFP
jgi:hypothetical protein